ncbi:MAG: anti-anti-sigma factor [Bacteroidetes bacterium]|nr:anti-anti-sigma factor [Bacteroidota bacterium]
MKVKIDTKEVFNVITIEEKVFTAIMAAELIKAIEDIQQQECLNIILNFQHVQEVETALLTVLEDIQQLQKGIGKSFVVCSMSGEIQQKLGVDKEYEKFHLPPTESEAWDIVQMEEIERELGLDI